MRRRVHSSPSAGGERGQAALGHLRQDAHVAGADMLARLLRLEEERRHAELAGARRSQVGAGDRSEKIRTYNFKENRVTDHRIDLTLYRLDQILAGDLDELVEAVVARRAAEELDDTEGRGLASR